MADLRTALAGITLQSAAARSAPPALVDVSVHWRCPTKGCGDVAQVAYGFCIKCAPPPRSR